MSLKKQLWIAAAIVVLGLLTALKLSQINSLGAPSTGTAHAETETGPTGPRGGQLLGEDQPLQLEILSQTRRGQLSLMLYAYRGQSPWPLKPDALKMTWQRLGNSQPLRFESAQQGLRSLDTIDAPHSFEASITLEADGQSYSYHWEHFERRLEMSEQELAASELRFVPATPQTLVNEVTLPGQIALDQDRLVHLSPRVQGTVEKVYKHLGESVTKGEVLAVLNSRELGDLRQNYLSASKRFSQAQQRYALEQQFARQTRSLLEGLQQKRPLDKLFQEIQALSAGEDQQTLIEAHTRYQLALANWEREQQLNSQQATSALDLEQAEKAWQDARFAYQGTLEAVARSRQLQLLEREFEREQLRPELEMAEKKLQAVGLSADTSSTQYMLRSPITGRIIEKHLAQGELLSAAKPAFVIADLSVVWAEMMAAESQLHLLRLGLPVTISSQDQKIRQNGEIAHIGSVINPETRSAEAHAEIDNPGQRWTPGMLVSITLKSAPRKVPLAVEQSAIQYFEDQPTVFVRHGKAIQAVPVSLGQQNSQWAEVRSGLQPGQLYLQQNTYLLKAELEKSSASHAH